MEVLPDQTDILVAGAGPAGCVTSMLLSKYEIPHILIDKASFPRDKICGDALSGKVLDVLNKINPDFTTEMNAGPELYSGCHGVKFVSPGGNFVDIPFTSNSSAGTLPKGFVSKRIHFDEFLFKKTISPFVKRFTEAAMVGLERNQAGISVMVKQHGQLRKINTRLIIGAEGDRSMVAKKLSVDKMDLKHYCAGIRAYYKGVKNLHPQNYIELHFLKELLPGYFWIFPLPNGDANVGIGMLSSVVSSGKINLREKMLAIIHEHPSLKERFSDAKSEGEIKGWGLPLGSLKRKLSGDNFLLTGDAASLIDPFTGEGIGNAMISGSFAAKAARKCICENNFEADFLKSVYDDPLYSALWNELKLSHKLQQLSSNAWLFNFIVNKASGNKTVRETISNMFENVDIRTKLKNPSFYLNLLFN